MKYRFRLPRTCHPLHTTLASTFQRALPASPQGSCVRTASAYPSAPVNRFRFLVTCLLVVGASLASGSRLHAQDAPASPAAPASDEPQGLEEVLRAAMAAFNAQDYPRAISGLNQVLQEVAPDAPQVEPVTFTLGAAYFNNKQYSEAISTFQKFLEKFPKSGRTNEVIFALGQAQLVSGDNAAAAATLRRLEAVPGMRDQVLLFQANAARNAGKPDDEIVVLEKLTAGGIRNEIAAKGAVQLATAYVGKGATDKAVALIQELQKNVTLVENIVALDALTLQLGDKLLEQGDYPNALQAFRRVRLKNEIIEAQRQRIAAMEARVNELQEQNRQDPARVSQNTPLITQTRADVESARKQLEAFEKTPPILGALYLRMAKAFYEQRMLWEALVVYQALLDNVPKGVEREPALYASVVTNADLGQGPAALAAADLYLKEFPTGPNAENVKYFRGTIALQLQDFDRGESWLVDLLNANPRPQIAQQILLLLGNAKFSQGKFDEAIAQYRKFAETYPDNEQAQEAIYRIALADLFNGKFEEAIKGFNDYLAKYPNGDFRGDAKYRLAVCEYAAQQYPQVIEMCLAWQKEFPDDGQSGEVASLLGDAYGALGKNDEAIAAYQQAYKNATTDEVLNYAIFEAAKMLQGQGRWDEISKMFEEFVRERPEHPTSLAALGWIGKAKAREGKSDEAKQFLAETVRKYIDDPNREPVEQMLAQLAQLTARRRRPAPPPEPSPAPAAANGETAAATPPPAPTPTPAPEIDPSAELANLLIFAKDTPTAQARALFAQAELARVRRLPEDQKKAIQRIADDFAPKDLSPPLLGIVGDYLLSVNDNDRAAAIFQYLFDYYPKSPFLDFAYAGLGEIAFRRGDYQTALRYFQDGTEQIAPNNKLKDLTLGSAKTLLALDRPDEAKPIFELVGSAREWRGEATAQSVYSLGEIQAKKGNWAEANAFFQRVFVTYRKFTPWVAKAYLSSANAFVKLGKNDEAIRTLNEMLRDEKLSALPEADLARKQLQQLRPQS